MLHGGGGSKETWEGIAPTLAQEFRVVAYDQPGHGASPRPEPLEPATFLDAIDEMIAATELDRPVLVGHSMGGAASLRYAARSSRGCRGVVALDGAIHRTPDVPVVRADETEYRAQLADQGFAPESHDFWWALRRAGEASNATESTALYAAIGCPVLLVHATGGMSSFGPHEPRGLAVLEAVASENPQIELVVLDAGHALHVDRPDEVVALVSSFARALR